jgi:hypothetical protein
MGSDHTVRVRGTTHLVADVVALDCIDLYVAFGQIHRLVGPTGAAKPTDAASPGVALTSWRPGSPSFSSRSPEGW